MKQRIPMPLIGLLAEVLPETETHDSLDNLFLVAGAPTPAPDGTKPFKVKAWLQRTNAESAKPLEVLGRILERTMEYHPTPRFPAADCEARKAKIEAGLRRAGLRYGSGGRITCGPKLETPTRSLESLIRDLDVEAINTEFERAVRSVDESPREAVSAACNLLESVCKVIIEKDGLSQPSSLDLPGVFRVVRKNLGLDPSILADNDLRAILSGLIAVAKGIGDLRTHASSAHGGGTRTYALQARHARLAIHAAHTLAGFILETRQARGSASA